MPPTIPHIIPILSGPGPGPGQPFPRARSPPFLLPVDSRTRRVAHAVTARTPLSQTRHVLPPCPNQRDTWCRYDLRHT
eukprot:6941689-Prymnesium_polylepis.1